MPTRRTRKRKTRRGGNWWNTGPSAEEFADEIIANLFNETYPFTEKINNISLNRLQKVMDKLIEKGDSLQGESRVKIIARLRQMKDKNKWYEQNAWSLSKAI